MIIQSLEKLHDANKSVRERGILEIIAISTQVPSKSRKGMSQGEKEELVKKLFNGLVSKKISIRETFFVVLTNFLRANKTFKEEWLLETLDNLIVSLSRGAAKAKSKDVKNLQVMGYGSLIRSDSIKKPENYRVVFEQLYKTSKSLTSNMPNNFVCLLLSKLDKKMFKQSLIRMTNQNEIVYVKEKSNGLVCVSIELMAKKHDVKAPTAILDNVELLVEVLSKEYKGGDNPLIEEIFYDLSERKLISSFWKLVDEKYLYFDLKALQVLQSIALSNKKCPRDLLVQYTLTLLNSSIGEYRDLGKELSIKTLVWDDSFAKNEKRRAKVINLFFGPESLLEHYKVIPQQYKKFLKDIMQKVEDIAQEIIAKCQENIGNGVLQLSSLNILYWMIVDQSLEIDQEHKMSILKSEFIVPFLRNSTAVEDEKNKENEETKKNISTAEFLRNIFSLSGDFNILLEGFDIVANDSHFLKTFPDEILSIWKNGLQLFDKLSGEFLLLIKLSLMRLLVTSNIQASNIDASFVDSKGKDEIMIIDKIIQEAVKCKKNEDKLASLIRIVMNYVLQMEAPFFNIELFFKKLDSEDKINCEHIKILADGILKEYENDEGISLKQHDIMEDEEMQTDDDQSSIDLDQASEESLKKLDKILAACVRKTENASNPKYLRIKRILQIIENCIIRSRNYNLIPSFLPQVINHYTNDGTALLEAKVCYKFLCKMRKLKKNSKCTIQVSKPTIENLIKEIQLIKDELEEEENDDSDEEDNEEIENMDVDENDDEDDEDEDDQVKGKNDNDDSDKEENENEDERIIVITQILKMLSKCFDI